MRTDEGEVEEMAGEERREEDRLGGRTYGSYCRGKRGKR